MFRGITRISTDFFSKSLFWSPFLRPLGPTSPSFHHFLSFFADAITGRSAVSVHFLHEIQQIGPNRKNHTSALIFFYRIGPKTRIGPILWNLTNERPCIFYQELQPTQKIKTPLGNSYTENRCTQKCNSWSRLRVRFRALSWRFSGSPREMVPKDGIESFWRSV